MELSPSLFPPHPVATTARPCPSFFSPRLLRIAERGRKRRRILQSRFSRPRGDSARQLLFLHSSKSSLESNLPVCYCIQTTPTTNLLLALSRSSRSPPGSFTGSVAGPSSMYTRVTAYTCAQRSLSFSLLSLPLPPPSLSLAYDKTHSRNFHTQTNSANFSSILFSPSHSFLPRTVKRTDFTRPRKLPCLSVIRHGTSPFTFSRFS